MHHLSLCPPKGKALSLELSKDVKISSHFIACFELNHMLHRLCGSPSIALSFNLAVVLPGGVLNALTTSALRGGNSLTLARSSFTAWTTRYLIPVCGARFAVQAWCRAGSARHWCSLHISAHFTASSGIPLRCRLPMSIHGWPGGFAHQLQEPPTPNNSG